MALAPQAPKFFFNFLIFFFFHHFNLTPHIQKAGSALVSRVGCLMIIYSCRPCWPDLVLDDLNVDKKILQNDDVLYSHGAGF
jgi:hypothetical protein